jgi:hypothetical protein
LLALSVLAMGGCGTIASPRPNLLGQLSGSPSNAASTPTPNAPACTIEVRGVSGKARRIQAPFRDGMVVQDALERSGALSRHRRVKIEVVRMAPDGQGRLKMQARFDPRNRRVDPGFDYALQPGDYVIISDDSAAMLNDMLDDTLGPFAPLVRA